MTSDRPDRFAALQTNIQTWAAGVDDVFNRSAAQTGGVRHVRYVTTTGSDGSCTPSVLRVVLPAGSNASFSSTITAMQNAGYHDPARKYLMWVDASGYCGIAQMYLDARHDQANANNGSYPQFARVDSACWGYSDSVEAHELEHTFGGVQNNAPNHSAAGHCTDESDRMCYSDGAGVTMRQVCPASQEALLDCNNNDYFSTSVTPGSYLAGSWNSADSRFLSGAGSGTTVGPRLDVGLAVNNPGVAGLPTQVTATPSDVAGRTVTLAWTSGRSDCVFADPHGVQTTVTCSAQSDAATTVTVTASDGVVMPVSATSPLTFSSAVRTATVALSVDGASGDRLAVCPRSTLSVVATVTDAASSVPVQGMPVELTRTVNRVTTVVGSGATAADGTVTVQLPAVDSATLAVRAAAWGSFSAVTGGTTLIGARTACASFLDSAVSATSVTFGDEVVVNGTFTRQAGTGTVPVAGERVTVGFRPAGSAATKAFGTAVTDGSGGYRVAGRPTTSGTVLASHAATSTYRLSAATPVDVVVNPYTTSVETVVSATQAGWKQPVTVSGRLLRSAGGVTSPAARMPVVVRYLSGGGGGARARLAAAHHRLRRGLHSAARPHGRGLGRRELRRGGRLHPPRRARPSRWTSAPGRRRWR